MTLIYKNLCNIRSPPVSVSLTVLKCAIYSECLKPRCCLRMLIRTPLSNSLIIKQKVTSQRQLRVVSSTWSKTFRSIVPFSFHEHLCWFHVCSRFSSKLDPPKYEYWIKNIMLWLIEGFLHWYLNDYNVKYQSGFLVMAQYFRIFWCEEIDSLFPYNLRRRMTQAGYHPSIMNSRD